MMVITIIMILKIVIIVYSHCKVVGPPLEPIYLYEHDTRIRAYAETAHLVTAKN